MHRALAEVIVLFQQGLANCTHANDREVVRGYLAALAPLLARAVLGEDILGRLASIERLFGHTWLSDVAPFEAAFARWRDFAAASTDHALGEMTVNERLVALALSDDFDRACAAGDAERARAILAQARIDAPSIEKIVRKCLSGE